MALIRKDTIIKLKLIALLQVCSFVQIIYAQTIELPPPLDLFEYSVPPGTEYGNSKQYGSIYNFPVFRLLGWSSDGKIAYSMERGIPGIGGTAYSYIIQDLITDCIVWELEEDNLEEGEDEIKELKYTPEESFQVHKKEIEEALNKYSIVHSASIYQKLPIKYGTYTIDVEKIVKNEFINEYGLTSIKYSLLAKRSDGKEKKIREEKEVIAERVYICGWFKSPYSNRAAVVIAEEKFVYEGTELFYSIVGCSMEAGF